MNIFRRPPKDHPFYSLIVLMDHVMVISVVSLIVLIILAGCTTTTKIVCPKLTAPPASVVDMLEGLGPKDPSAAAWTIDLDKHYQKLEAC